MPTYLLKIVTVGSASVGKTSMIVRYSTGAFREHYSPTLGAGFAYKKMKLGEDQVNLQIWDMGSQSFLERVRATYYNGAAGVMFLYDVTQWESLHEITDWKEEVDQNLDNYVPLLVANKTDLVMERVVSRDEGMEFANEFEENYIEASVRLNRNVNEAFALLAKKIIERFFSDNENPGV